MDAFLKLPPAVGKVLGMKFWASIISTIGPSFLTFGHLNISRVLEGSRSLICVVSRGKLGAQTGPVMLMMLALGAKTLKIHAVGSVCGCKYQ